MIAQLTITAIATTAATTTTTPPTTTTTTTTNLWYSLIIAFVGIAGPTSAYEAFEDNLDSLYMEVHKYCNSHAEYKKSDDGKKYG